METRLEIQPDKTLLVIGPAFAASLLDKEGGCTRQPPLTYTAFKTQLAEAARRLEERPRIEEGAGAVETNLRVLKKSKFLKQWLESTFNNTGSVVVETPLLQQIVKMQQLGALVAYLHMDSLVEDSLHQPGYTAKDAGAWIKTPGILHPFGHYRDPESLVEGCRPAVPPSLAQVLTERTCLYIGFYDDVKENVLLKNFMQVASAYSNRVSFCIQPQSSTTFNSLGLPSSALTINNVCLPDGLCHLEKTSKELGK